MELDFDQDQEDLRDAVRAFLTAECPISRVRAIVETRIMGGSAGAPDLHTRMVDLGWPALAIPESAGGLGLGAVEVAIVAEELGRALAPGPLLATISQFVPLVTAVAASDQVDALLASVATGAIAGTVAVAEATGVVDPAATTVTLTPSGGGFVLAGVKHSVIEPAPGGTIAVVGRHAGTAGEDGLVVALVPVDTCAVRPIDAVDPSRALATVTFDGVHVPSVSVLGDPGAATAAGVRAATDHAVVGLALDTVGTAQQLFDISLDYVSQREQFGVPVGSFQSMKHKFADMLLLLERARALGYYAALSLSEQDERAPLAAAMAKAAAGDAAVRIAKEGIQVHGGIGFTWESDVHLYVRRLESDAVLFGSADQHRQRVADLIGV